jgi:GntR family transcriptional repressor for pyruvate dehydrogenase complex
VVGEDLLNRVVSGEFPINSALPREHEITLDHEVSRLTVREAIKQLEAQGVVRVERGKGTYVNPLSRWTSMEAVLRALSQREADATGFVQLIQVRKMLETGAAELAAQNISRQELEAIRMHLETMESAHQAYDVERFVKADLAFHDEILQASGNMFLRILFKPIDLLLSAHRTETSKVTQIQAHAIREHTTIVEALESGRSELAAEAMAGHINQTLEDFKNYILNVERL